MAPNRADYNNVKIFHKTPRKEYKKNYIMIKPNKMILYLNEYKTSDKYG